MNKNIFWDFFDNEASAKLLHREKTFRKIFEYLDKIPGPINIIETGCVRETNNWGGDGQSTILFDNYISQRDNESICYTVDNNPRSVNACKSLVSSRVSVNLSDSVSFLSNLSKKFIEESKKVNFLYLDSYDLDMNYWYPSAAHHLKELLAIIKVLKQDTLVVVDDCPLNVNYIAGVDNHAIFISEPAVGGKGRLIAEYAIACNAKLEFSDYQAGWTGFT